MKGIILAGGTGTRLLPLTAVTSKQLLPVYDRPMIFYPLNTLVTAGITDILIIIAPTYSGDFLNLLGSIFRTHGIRISFIVQKAPRGLAEAFILGEDFMDDEPVVLALGDNVFEDDFSEVIRSFQSGSRIFAKEVADPERFGVVEFHGERQSVVSIEEKPAQPRSRFAIPGLYIFDARVSKFARALKPSARGEIEIVDLHRAYLAKNELDVRIISGAWFDTGTPDALLAAGIYAKAARLSERFDPRVNQAIHEFNREYKQLMTFTNFS